MDEMRFPRFQAGKMASFTPRQAAAELDGVRTVVFVQSYADRTLVLVTQVGKVGRLVRFGAF